MNVEDCLAMIGKEVLFSENNKGNTRIGVLRRVRKNERDELRIECVVEDSEQWLWRVNLHEGGILILAESVEHVRVDIE